MSDEPPREIEPGRRLVRVGGDRGLSLGERLARQFQRLTWRSPLHTQRLKGRFPLKLLGVPRDPLVGDARAGAAFLGGGLRHHGARGDFDASWASPLPDPLDAYVQRFAWLRDVAAAKAGATGQAAAEAAMRGWIARHGATVDARAWRPDWCAWRIFNWACHAPLILASTDIVYRSAVLHALARQARHLDRMADRAPPGLPRITAWAGVVASGLIIPGGDIRRDAGEDGLARALGAFVTGDGGIVTRAPADQLGLTEVLTILTRIYDMRGVDAAPAVSDTLARAVAALIALAMGDGALSSWQGSGPVAFADVDALVRASGVRARPMKAPREWGYHRLSGGATIAIIDAGTPPPARLQVHGSASTLAFELSDGEQRLIVNCGGAAGRAAMGRALAQGLRTTAAHSTLTLADTNSTAILSDGALGPGVNAVEVDRVDGADGIRVDATHDGYSKAFALAHKRTIVLATDGTEVRGEDALLPVGRRRRGAATTGFAVRFHLAPGVEPTLTADGQAALLRALNGPLWQFRCTGGTLQIEESVWIDARGHIVPTSQLVVTGTTPPGGATVAWIMKRAGTRRR